MFFDPGNFPTSAVPLISHAHGRRRREERGIDRRELQAAVKHGRCEPARPGPGGEPRLRFTHQGVVYVTDITCRHEITSWRLEDAMAHAGHPRLRGDYDAHILLIVDLSGSMRKGDVAGFGSRAEAVYMSLARDLLGPQLSGRKLDDHSKVVVSVIEMRDQADVVIKRCKLDEWLLSFLCEKSRDPKPRSHGNYLPALLAARELLKEDERTDSQLFVMFLSDGAPSDHICMECAHGIKVWETDPSYRFSYKGKPALNRCISASMCRASITKHVSRQCVKEVMKMGDIFGRDRLYFGAIAFGPLSEQYDVLQQMGQQLPRGCFEKLGLSANSLKTALSTLTSTFTTLCTAAGGPPLTLRQLPSTSGGDSHREQSFEYGIRIIDDGTWDIYHVRHKEVRHKLRWDLASKKWQSLPMKPGAGGIAHADSYHDEGAERLVFYCTEVVLLHNECFDEYFDEYARIGPWMVSKQTKHEEYLQDHLQFLRKHCQVQALAEQLATEFNNEMAIRGIAAAGTKYVVHFVDCTVYGVYHPQYSGSSADGIAWFLAEDELEGQFFKWNDNKGGVREPLKRQSSQVNVAEISDLFSGLAVVEEDEEEEEEEEDLLADNNLNRQITPDDIPQAFSHFTYHVTNGRKLVCDIQGVYNHVDGFLLTDPVIHEVCRSGKRHKNGATDRGTEGMDMFFNTHVCNPVCARLGLHRYHQYH